MTPHSGDCTWEQQTFGEVLDTSSKWILKVKDSEQHHASSGWSGGGGGGVVEAR